MVSANLNGSYHSAIIGMDAQFTNQVSVQGNIDRVERALYLGTIPGNVVRKIIDEEQNHRSAEESDFTQFSMENCQQAVDRMATANQLNSSNIPSGITFYLVDSLLNTNTNLSVEGAVYACLVNEETYNSNRFMLSLQIANDISIVELNEELIDVYTSANGLELNISGEVSETLSLSGQMSLLPTLHSF